MSCPDFTLSVSLKSGLGRRLRVYTSRPRALAICMVSASCPEIAICLNKDQHREHKLHFAKQERLPCCIYPQILRVLLLAQL